jgi:hypothetical protein
MKSVQQIIDLYLIVGGISALVFFVSAVAYVIAGYVLERQEASLHSLLMWCARTVLGAVYVCLAWPVIWVLVVERAFNYLWPSH